MGEILRNKVTITNVHIMHGRQFAFGAVLEPEPRTVYFPYWIIHAYKIVSEDRGLVFDCLFIEQEGHRNPTVIAILDDEDGLEESEVVGEYEGKPGSKEFTAIINSLNRP